VPNPGNPQSLNRYSYAGNRPTVLIDPSGHAECAAGDTACWQQRWHAQNDWYNAHGYSWDGSFWSIIQGAAFATEQLLYDTVGEAGISFANGWNWKTQQAQMTAIGQGVVNFGQALGAGIAQLKNLLGGGAALHHVANTPWYCFGAPACALPPGTNNVYFSTDFLTNNTPAWISMTTVHELAHVIDWHSRIGLGSGKYGWSNFSAAWHGAPVTDYAACGGALCVNRWERWAEAVTVWVFGSAYPGQRTVNDLTVQMGRIGAILNGEY